MEHVKAGNNALALNDPRAAVAEFETALRLDPSLTRNETFMTKLREARREASFTSGQTLMQAQQWQAAIEQFQETLRLAPDYEPAQRTLEQAREGGARAAYKGALAEADQGDLQAASQLLSKALQYDPDHAGARQAMASMRDPNVVAPQAREAFQAGQQLMEGQRWAAAVVQFDRAVQADVNSLPARAARAEAMQRLTQAEALRTSAADAVKRGDLNEAARQLEQALDLWPDDESAAALLNEVRQRQERGRQQMALAREALASRNWDKAAEAARRALEAHPNLEEADQLLDQIQEQAANVWVAAGQEHLAVGQLEQAWEAFSQALRYQPQNPKARAGLAEISGTRARQAAEADRWGRALLLYRQAADLSPGGPWESQAREAMERVRERLAFVLGVDVTVSDVRIPVSPETARLQLIGQLRQSLPVWVQALPAREARNPAYVAQVSVSELEVEQRRANIRQREHVIQESELMPNPELPRLDRLAYLYRREVYELRDRTERLRDAYRKARAELTEESDAEARRQVERLRRRVLEAEDDLERRERNLREVERDLRLAPRMVERRIEVVVPYREETWQKAATLVLRAQVIGPEGQSTASFQIRKQTSAEDVINLNVEPGLGVEVEPLNLPSDEAMVRQLLAEALNEAGRRLSAAVLEAEANALEALAARGTPAERVEAGVGAAVVLESLRPAVAKQRWKELRSAVSE